MGKPESLLVYATVHPARLLGQRLAWKALDSGMPAIDASRAVMATHQNHDYSYHPQGKAGVWTREEAGRNAQLAGDGTTSAVSPTPPKSSRRKDLSQMFSGICLPQNATFAKPAAFCFTTCATPLGSHSLTRPLRRSLRHSPRR